MLSLSDEINARLDIVQLVSRYVKLKRSGVNYVGLCPFHNEKTPSFVVSPHKQIFKCFGCGEGGNALHFFMKIERMDFWDAVETLGKELNIDIQQYRKNFGMSSDDKKYYESEKEKMKACLEVAQQFFRENLHQNEEAKTYLLTKRNLPDTIIERFGFGYAPPNGHILPRYLETKGFDKKTIQHVGLGKQDVDGNMYSFFRHRITIPIFDTLGHVVGFGARALNPQDTPKYLNTPETSLYQKSKILYGVNRLKETVKEHNKVIVVEGYMDAIALAVGGFPIGVATCGTALTHDHLMVLKRYTDNIYFLFDNDEAGQKATLRALKLAYEINLFPKVLTIPAGYKDIDDVVMGRKTLQSENEQADNIPQSPLDKDQKKKVLQNLLDSGQDGFERAFDSLLKQYDITSAQEKQKFLTAIFDILHAISSPVIHHDYLQQSARKLHIKEDILFAQYKQFMKDMPSWQNQRKNVEEVGKQRKPDPFKLLENLLQEQFLYDQGIYHEHVIQALQKLRKKIKEVKSKAKRENVQEENDLTKAEYQLRREKELAYCTKTVEKTAVIRRIVLNHLVEHIVPQIIKMENLAVDEKQEIMHLLQEVKKSIPDAKKQERSKPKM